MVPGTGLEPVSPIGRKILSLVCLPVSPPRHIMNRIIAYLERRTIKIRCGVFAMVTAMNLLTGYSFKDNNEALPPAAVVSVLTERSTAKR